jgi:hypothetical protein
VRTSRKHLTAVQQALDEQADGTAGPPKDGQDRGSDPMARDS